MHSIKPVTGSQNTTTRRDVLEDFDWHRNRHLPWHADVVENEWVCPPAMPQLAQSGKVNHPDSRTCRKGL